ncbi:MAG: SDR family NAD(P)-dependent oxidoreductase [Chloroflexota bacterium]
MNEFAGKVALVTGAGKGSGRAVAQAFAARGAVVAANDLTPINLDETLESIQSQGGRARDYIFDVAKKMPIQALVEAVLRDWERIDFLVTCASVQPQATVLNMDEWDWHRTMDVNLAGPFFCMQVVGRVMRQQGGGSIVNIIATSGQDQVLPGQAAYLASQSGLMALTRAAAQELADHKIRVNTVCLPALGPTPLTSALTDEQAYLYQEAAQAAVSLCSQSAVDTTGQIIHIPGG